MLATADCLAVATILDYAKYFTARVTESREELLDIDKDLAATIAKLEKARKPSAAELDRIAPAGRALRHLARRSAEVRARGRSCSLSFGGCRERSRSSPAADVVPEVARELGSSRTTRRSSVLGQSRLLPGRSHNDVLVGGAAGVCRLLVDALAAGERLPAVTTAGSSPEAVRHSPGTTATTCATTRARIPRRVISVW